MVEISVSRWCELEDVLRAGVVEPVRVIVAGVCVGDLYPERDNISAINEESSKSPLEAAVELLIKENQQHQATSDAALSSEEKFSHFFNYSPTPTRIEDWSNAKAFLKAELRRNDASLSFGQLSVNACEAFLNENPQIVSQCLSYVDVIDFNPAFLTLIDASHEPTYATRIGELLASSAMTDVVRLLSDILDHCRHAVNANSS